MHRDEICALLSQRAIHSALVIGSVARGEDVAGSDLDLLVEYPEGTSLLDEVALRLDLQDLLGIPSTSSRRIR